MSRTQVSLIRKAAFAGLFALCASTAIAQTSSPATGLGQSWPNAADQSVSPNWHVYVFMLNGIKYIQINDLGGTVHAAIGTANGSSIVLPVGVDSQNVSTSSSSNSSSTQVYNDGTTAVTATPQSNGTTQFSVLQAAPCSTPNCGGNGGS
ncbi:hypothetical protein DWU98_05610 [Dyella monticola]|uniref:Uncharacterized protein n=1 Tax=Dyella monticola TaxID=1927958 RepID=A0A370X6A7_9GAMM|nr:hypothetical protein [Dyella monticola]RDS83791.1 hypothetical protein DWU98_05610 [Dyella monticola]